MSSFFLKQWFLIGMVVASFLGYLCPGWADFLNQFHVFGIAIFLAFFMTGLCLETRNILRQIKDIRPPIAAVASSLFLYPAVAWLTALPVLQQEFVIGVCIISVGPVTVSSGTIMTAIAKGNVPLSIFICILTSFIAIFTIPLMLNFMLDVGGKVDLPVLNMFGGLVVKVLLPIVLGQIIRPFVKRKIRKFSSFFAVFQSCIIILIIFRAVSSSAGSFNQAGVSSIIGLITFVLFLHVTMLFVNYNLARWMRLDVQSESAFTIHTSQKTLTITYVVWASYFAGDYPMAFLPAIFCQLTQMFADTFVAKHFRRKAINHLRIKQDPPPVRR